MGDKKARLDQFVVDIEFLLISVVQGVALAALAAAASGTVGNLQFEYVLYVVSAFLLILNFWSQAIIHTLSFIDWPLDMTHNFLYFLVSLVEVMAFSQITNPLKWFAFMTLFFVVAAILYGFDLSLIRKHEEKFKDSKERQSLFRHIIAREKFEMFILLPGGLLFNIAAFVLIYLMPEVFITQKFHILLISLQVVFSLGVLVSSVRNFRKRSSLITSSILK